jgi:membrane protein DedA with SNARE-associated domain
MSSALEFMRPIIEGIIEAIGYPGVFLIMLLENLFPPIPSEFVMPFAGFLAGRGGMNFWGAVAAGTSGSVVGAIALYYIGYFVGEPVLRGFIRRWGRVWMLSEADLDRALDFFQRRGYIVVFAARVIPIVRSLISVPAGMGRMPIVPFILLTTAGSFVWTLILGYAGLLLGENWETILGFIKQYERAVLVILVIALAIFVWRWVATHRGRRDDAGSRFNVQGSTGTGR